MFRVFYLKTVKKAKGKIMFEDDLKTTPDKDLIVRIGVGTLTLILKRKKKN